MFNRIMLNRVLLKKRKLNFNFENIFEFLIPFSRFYSKIPINRPAYSSSRYSIVGSGYIQKSIEISAGVRGTISLLKKNLIQYE